jgi:hypothetical protein
MVEIVGGATLKFITFNMNLRPEIELIKQQLDEVEDEKLLQIIRELLAYRKAKSKTLKPFTKEEYFQRNDKSMKAIEQRNLIAQEDAVKYFKGKRRSD